MFAMTSFGAKVNDSVNRGMGPYVFKISGQIYHWIGSLCPEEGDHPRFLQMYIYNTDNEVSNEMRHFGRLDGAALNPEIVEGLIHVINEHNGLVRLFKTARDRCGASQIPGFTIRLYNMGDMRGYELPTLDILGGIVFESVPRSRTDFDVIIEFIGGPPKRINKRHQSYMSLQFPLLFIFGQPGCYPRIEVEASRWQGPRKKVMYTIEFQKRGLPHCHTLLWVDLKNKIQDASQIDEYISAELPDPVKDPLGFKVVSELMLHGPCGAANLSATSFEAHINVEYYGWSMLIKYLFKYISKGPYRILVNISRPIGEPSTSTSGNNKKIDEIQNYVDGRFICPYKACWRIFEFPIHSQEPAVQILNVQLEDMQRVTFHERERLDINVNIPEQKKTTLTEWFVYNNENTNGELFYFRMLLCHRKGCKSPIEVRTLKNEIFLTYRAACEALGLLGDDKEWDISLEESTLSATSAEIRTLFA
ncbi:hypothetical protein Tco_0645247 [Tanacetum coccineum]